MEIVGSFLKISNVLHCLPIIGALLKCYQIVKTASDFGKATKKLNKSVLSCDTANTEINGRIEWLQEKRAHKSKSASPFLCQFLSN